MPRPDAIQAEGTVIEVLAELRFRVELANGHRLLGLVPRKSRRADLMLKPGDTVRLELSPFDLSKGRIVLE